MNKFPTPQLFKLIKREQTVTGLVNLTRGMIFWNSYDLFMNNVLTKIHYTTSDYILKNNTPSPFLSYSKYTYRQTQTV